MEDDYKAVVHDVPLGKTNLCVCVNVSLNDEAQLPIPVPGKYLFVKHAIGTHVAWPKEFIVMMSEEKQNASLKRAILKPNNVKLEYHIDEEKIASLKTPILKANKVKLENHMMADEKYIEESKMLATNSVTQESLKMPLAINFLYRLTKRTMDKNDTVAIHVESDVFGNEFTTYLFRDDIIAFCTMSEITTSCITLYMRHLYSVLKVMNFDGLYGFVEPGRISYGSGKSEERSRKLADRLITASIGQIFLAPYNVGNHWMLLGIEPYSEAVYFFDPLQQAVPSDMKQVVNLALKMFNAENGKKSRANPWKEMKCPLQPGSVECGYYVLKYMKDIIEDQNLVMSDKLKEKDTYTQDEIDEMRVQWAEILDANMSI